MMIIMMKMITTTLKVTMTMMTVTTTRIIGGDDSDIDDHNDDNDHPQTTHQRQFIQFVGWRPGVKKMLVYLFFSTQLIAWYKSANFCFPLHHKCSVGKLLLTKDFTVEPVLV